MTANLLKEIDRLAFLCATGRATKKERKRLESLRNRRDTEGLPKERKSQAREEGR